MIKLTWSFLSTNKVCRLETGQLSYNKIFYTHALLPQSVSKECELTAKV